MAGARAEGVFSGEFVAGCKAFLVGWDVSDVILLGCAFGV